MVLHVRPDVDTSFEERSCSADHRDNRAAIGQNKGIDGRDNY